MKRLWIALALVSLFAIGPPKMNAATVNIGDEDIAKQTLNASNPFVALGGATAVLHSRTATELVELTLEPFLHSKKPWKKISFRKVLDRNRHLEGRHRLTAARNAQLGIDDDHYNSVIRRVGHDPTTNGALNCS